MIHPFPSLFFHSPISFAKGTINNVTDVYHMYHMRINACFYAFKLYQMHEMYHPKNDTILRRHMIIMIAAERNEKKKCWKSKKAPWFIR